MSSFSFFSFFCGFLLHCFHPNLDISSKILAILFLVKDCGCVGFV